MVEESLKDGLMITYNLEQFQEKVLPVLKPLLVGDAIFLLNGHLGAGKTTLVRSLLKHCLAVENVNSPTFTYVQEYVSRQGLCVYHFDLYRLQEWHQVEDLGLKELFEAPNSISFVEWPRIGEAFWPTLKNIKQVYLLDLSLLAGADYTQGRQLWVRRLY